MMQGNSKKKMGSLIAAVVIIVLVVALIAAFVLLINGEENAGADGILWAYIAVLGAVIIGVLISLWQRFKEISKGEEEEAKKY